MIAELLNGLPPQTVLRLAVVNLKDPNVTIPQGLDIEDGETEGIGVKK